MMHFQTVDSFLPPGAEDDNANDCNMSQLLELCSGKFQGGFHQRKECSDPYVACCSGSCNNLSPAYARREKNRVLFLKSLQLFSFKKFSTSCFAKFRMSI